MKDAATRLSHLSDEDKKRIKLTFSMNDQPSFKRLGQTFEDARLTAQTDTFLYAWDNGIPIQYRHVHEKRGDVISELRGCVSSFDDNLSNQAYIRVYDKAEGTKAVGRQRENAGSECDLADRSSPSCIFDARYAGSGIKVKLNFLEKECSESLGVMAFGITGDGILIPGCCAFESPYVQVADLKSVKDRDELRAKTRAFLDRLIRVSYPDLINDGRPRKREPSCADCLVFAEKIRDIGRAERSLGPKLIRRIKTLREGRQ